MRVHRVEITAFGPFKDIQTVDFDAFADDGLFLISGKTGSGKTSILDAVCYGLYGSVPRYENTAEARYRSDHAEADAEPRVTVEFTVGETTYRVTRSPQFDRPKKKGEGFTTQKAHAGLSRWERDTWAGIAEGDRNVATQIAEIVQLTKDQFLQVMLLAQNRFQEFLVARSEDRRALLQTLFHTRRFEDYEKYLMDRSRALGDSVESLRGQVQHAVDQLVDRTESPPFTADVSAGDEVKPWLERLLDAEATRVAAAKDHAVATATAALEARTDLERLRDLWGKQSRRANAEARLAAAEAQAEQVEAWRRVIEVAGRAAAVRPALVAEREARAEAAETMSTLTSTTSTYAALVAEFGDRIPVPRTDASIAELEQGDEDLTTLLGSLAAPRDTEHTLPHLTDATEEAMKRLAHHDATLDTLATEQARIEEQLDTKAGQLEEARLAAAEMPVAKVNLADVESALRAARQVVAAEADHKAALSEQVIHGREHSIAVGGLQALWQRRLDGFAGKLASELADGAPCPVCGSSQHPAPAEQVQDEITEDAITAAEAAERAAQEQIEAASRAVATTQSKLAGLRARADGREVADLADKLTAATKQLAEADHAEEVASALDAEHRALLDQRGTAQTTRAALIEARDGFVAEHARAKNESESAAVEVARARGPFTTVELRVRALVEGRDAVRALVVASKAEHAASSSLETVRKTLKAALADHGFASADDADQAILPGTEVDELTTKVDTHTRAMAAAVAALKDSDLQDLPAEPIDLGPAEVVSTAADSARDAAAAAHGGAVERDRGARRHGEEIISALTELATAGTEHEAVKRLAYTVHGNPPNDRKMRLVDFVLAAELEDIVAAANLRLQSMSTGRYTLEHSDAAGRGQSGLGLQVLDHHTGESRSTASLSGGETFLASLALALGLAETVTNRASGIRLDTLFIDEGFGSLDAETLEVAMATLDSLRSGGRTVGVISHVEAMREQIPAKLLVSTVDGGWSEIHQ